jgi:hypothetical protein
LFFAFRCRRPSGRSPWRSVRFVHQYLLANGIITDLSGEDKLPGEVLTGVRFLF